MLVDISKPVNKPFVKPKTPEELGFNVNTQGIYAMCETTWADAMIGQHARTGTYTLQFGLGDTTSNTMINRFGTLSSSKNLEEQKFFIDALPNPGYRDHELHRVIRESFAYQVSSSKTKREVFACAIEECLVKEFIKTSDFEPIRQWLSDQLRKCASQLDKNHAKLGVKLRDIQLTVLKKIIKTIHRNGIGSNIIAELAPRLGKTILFLMVAKELREEFGHEAMFVLAYGVGLSVKASYKEEINKFQDFNEFMFVDNAEVNAQEQYEDAIANGKFPVVFVSLNAKIKKDDDEKEERLDWITTRTEKSIALLEETDFGVHTDSQIEKTQKMFANMEVTQINSSGTNIGRIAKASGDNPADEIIRVPYCMVEQDGSIPNIVKRKFYNMTFNPAMNKDLEGFDKDVLPNITKILADANTQEQFLTKLFQDIYGYEPVYGLSINRQAKEVIKHSMLFTTITKMQMKQLAKVIETACKNHKVLILTSDETSNKEAQSRTFEELVALENGKYGERDKLIVITNMMGTRSYSVPQIQACLFMMEGGDIYPYMQRYSRCLTPGGGKKFGHIFDFSFDQNKTRNTEMAIAVEAAAVMEQKDISFPDAVREVMFSVSLTDKLLGEWTANDAIDRFEKDANIYVQVADALTRLGIEDFADSDFPFLAELAKRAMSNTEKSNFKKIIKTGKTYEKKKRNGEDTTPDEDKAYAKALKDAALIIKRAIKTLNEGASTIAGFTNYEGKTYEQCLDIIANSDKLSIEFNEMFGTPVEFVIKSKDKLSLATLDMIIEKTNRGVSEYNVSNSSLGIVADSPELWREILSTRTMRRKLNSNKCKRILVVAGGLGTEIDVLVELYGIDILDKIVYNEKYTSFCNRIKRKYPQLTVMQGDFLELDIDMKFDVVIGNPPYQDTKEHGKKTTGDGALWVRFTEKAFSLVKDNGVVSFVIPDSVLAPTYDKMGSRISLFNDVLKSYNLKYLNLDVKKFFKHVGTFPIAFICQKNKEYNNTDVKTKDSTISLDISDMSFIPKDYNELSLSIHQRILSNVVNTNLFKMRWIKEVTALDNAQEEKSKSHMYPVVDSHSFKDTRWSDKKDPDFNKRKVLVTYVGNYQCIIDDGNCGAKKAVSIRFLNDNETVESANSFYNSKLINYVMNSNKWTQYLLSQILNNISPPVLDKVYTDEELYNYFNLTLEECNYIEEYVK